MCYLPEGYNKTPKLYTDNDIDRLINEQTPVSGFATTFSGEKILYAKFTTKETNYIVEIPAAEAVMRAPATGTKEVAIISRIGCPIYFILTGVKAAGTLTASRAMAQQLCSKNYLSHLRPGRIIPCVVTHIEPFGAFCDIGCGISALLPIDCVSVSRIRSPADRLFTGQCIYCVVKSIDELGRFVLTLKELLGTWEENAALFLPASTVLGTVRTVESYGIFVELTPNLTGLAEVYPGATPGDKVSVYIKSIVPEKMKIKLVILKILKSELTPEPLVYYIKDELISHWQYSPPGCEKFVETVFGATN